MRFSLLLRVYWRQSLCLLLLIALAFVIFDTPLGMSPAQKTPLATLGSRISVSRPSMYYGVHINSWLQDLSAVTSFDQDVKKAPSIIMWYQGWGLNDASRNFEPTWMNNVRNFGAIPLVSWEPWDYTRGLTQADFSLQSIATGKYDAYIIRWAQDSKAWGHPYFLRFAAEMNGNWYPWSEQVNGNHAGDYVRAWRHVHDIFTAQKVTNVTWVWSPNVEFARSTPLKELYPGAAYVDWVGIDGYNWSTVQGHQWQSFQQVFQQTYHDMLALAAGKPLMVAETASAEVGGNKAAWIADAFGRQLTSSAFSAVKAVIWFNESKETDWRVESSNGAKQAFASAIAAPIYASNQYAHLNVSPISPPGLKIQSPVKRPQRHNKIIAILPLQEET